MNYKSSQNSICSSAREKDLFYWIKFFFHTFLLLQDVIHFLYPIFTTLMLKYGKPFTEFKFSHFSYFLMYNQIFTILRIFFCFYSMCASKKISSGIWKILY